MTPDVLEAVDRLIPDYIEKNKNRVGRYVRRGRPVLAAYDKFNTFAAGVSLVTLGVILLAPGPGDAIASLAGGMIAGYFFGASATGTGVLIALAIVNIIPIVMIVVGIGMIVHSIFF